MLTRRRGLFGSLALTAAWPAAGLAQPAYPNKPIRIVHGYGPGSNPDIIARVISPSLMSTLGQSVIVEPKPGAGERIAAQYLATQPPDGYTLYLITGGANVISATDPQVTFSTLKDFSYISTITLFPFALFVATNGPYKTLKDLVDDGKKRPNEIIFSSSGLYGALHLPAALFLKAADIQMRHLPTNGGGPALTAILGNNAQVLASSIAAASVQRPSPESDTRPSNSASCESSRSALAVRSSSQELITLPWRQTSVMREMSKSY